MEEEDIYNQPANRAYRDEINTTINKGFGMSGALSNGVLRDLGDMAEGFPVVAGSIGPSNGFVHVKEIGSPVTIFGMTVGQGDLIHADRHGAVVIPPDVLGNLATSIQKMQEAENLILEPARQLGFDFATFERAWGAFEKSRT